MAQDKNLKIPAALHGELVVLSHRTGIPVKTLMSEAIKRFVADVAERKVVVTLTDGVPREFQTDFIEDRKGAEQ